jgi:hypothetical protein
MKVVKPIDMKVSVKPVFAQLVHSAPYEGPCRIGKKEALMPEVDRLRGREQFGRFVEDLKKNLGPDAVLLEPVYMEWRNDFVVPEDELKKLEPDVSDADLILIAANGITQLPAVTIGQRYGKPLGIIGWDASSDQRVQIIYKAIAWMTSVDITAYLRARGLEGYAFLDFDELNRFVSLLRVRKAVRGTNLLLALEGGIISAGVASSIYDMETLKRGTVWTIPASPQGIS